ncbi:hypothetical protein B0H12DRAFT_292784 [Mycena haematopus]|nr:hypothetical protein B0H12DRAFT_292784 [Mycena haematopus]
MDSEIPVHILATLNEFRTLCRQAQTCVAETIALWDETATALRGNLLSSILGPSFWRFISESSFMWDYALVRQQTVIADFPSLRTKAEMAAFSGLAHIIERIEAERAPDAADSEVERPNFSLAFLAFRRLEFILWYYTVVPGLSGANRGLRHELPPLSDLLHAEVGM